MSHVPSSPNGGQSKPRASSAPRRNPLSPSSVHTTVPTPSTLTMQRPASPSANTNAGGAPRPALCQGRGPSSGTRSRLRQPHAMPLSPNGGQSRPRASSVPRRIPLSPPCAICPTTGHTEGPTVPPPPTPMRQQLASPPANAGASMPPHYQGQSIPQSPQPNYQMMSSKQSASPTTRQLNGRTLASVRGATLTTGKLNGHTISSMRRALPTPRQSSQAVPRASSRIRQSPSPSAMSISDLSYTSQMSKRIAIDPE